MKPGDTFHSAIDRHLWVVLTNPADTGGKMVCVSFTTEREWSDSTTRCAAGEHPFFKHDTVVAYNLAALISEKKMADFLDGGTFTKKQPCSKALFDKVMDGLLTSDFTPNFIRKAIE